MGAWRFPLSAALRAAVNTLPMARFSSAMSSPPPPIVQLDLRAREIFREIVESYLESGEPVGSRTLSKRGSSGLSPASIRNTMADLAAIGLLDAPHTMAGRRPTEQGLRFFIDSLLEIGDLRDEEQRAIEARLSAGSSVAKMLNEATDYLSGIAGGASVVLTAPHEAPVKHVEFVAVGPGQALAVLVFADNQVENRLIETPPGLPPGALQEASNFLNASLRGRTLAEARAEVNHTLAQNRAALDAAAAQLISKGLAEWSGEDAERGRSLIVRGRANLLQDAKAVEDLERVRQLFEDLEKTQNLLQILDLAGEAEAVRIFIGSENPLFSMSGSSLVVAPYMNAERKVLGALGVIGPTRMNYARVIPVIDYTARALGRVLERRGSELK